MDGDFLEHRNKGSRERSFIYEVFQGIEKPANGWDATSMQLILEILNLTEGEFEEAYEEPLSAVLEWQEEGGNLGTHQNTGAGEVLTLDEIYDKAENDWLVKMRIGRFILKMKTTA